MKNGKGRHAWSPQRVYFSARCFRKFDMEHDDPKMYQSYKTLRLRSEMSLLKPQLIPFRANPQSCQLNYQRVFGHLLWVYFRQTFFSYTVSTVNMSPCRSWPSSTRHRQATKQPKFDCDWLFRCWTWTYPGWWFGTFVIFPYVGDVIIAID